MQQATARQLISIHELGEVLAESLDVPRAAEIALSVIKRGGAGTVFGRQLAAADRLPSLAMEQVSVNLGRAARFGKTIRERVATPGERIDRWRS